MSKLSPEIPQSSLKPQTCAFSALSQQHEIRAMLRHHGVVPDAKSYLAVLAGFHLSHPPFWPIEATAASSCILDEASIALNIGCSRSIVARSATAENIALNGRPIMENSCSFQAITHFSVVRVEKRNPRLDSIARLTMRIESKSPSGRHHLILIEPFPPFGRPCEDSTRLASLDASDINEIWAFRKPGDGEWARVEIRAKAPGMSIFVRCKQIEDVPGWDEM